MSRRAPRYLSRLATLTGQLSFPTAVTDGTIKIEVPEDCARLRLRLLSAARSDAQTVNEARALAEERGWILIRYGTGHERWPRLDDSTLRDALPRIIRILQREEWEMRDMAREADDEDVSSLLFAAAAEREALVQDLSRMEPIAARPGS